MASYINRAMTAEDEIRALSRRTQRHVSMLGARCIMFEAALAIIQKHDLLMELVAEHSRMWERSQCLRADYVDPEFAPIGA